MKLKFRHILLISIFTTLTALGTSLVALNNSGGYAGIFFIYISPIVGLGYIIWTFLLHLLINKQNTFKQFIISLSATLVFEYFMTIYGMYALSNDKSSYDLKDFFADCMDMFYDKRVLFCMLTSAIIYSLLLIIFLAKTDDTQQKNITTQT